ncbi:MAG: tRNA lysidine(34) synthetase TilS [Anaerolineales bacterium]|nr:tRNA lysidine(34) synthetase TilS [Anaerolineales bacterium]
MDLRKQVAAFFATLAEGARPFPLPIPKLIVGVSGGPDSLALLHVLKEVLGAERLVIAHLNHGLRPSAAAEAQFVAETAVSHHIPHHIATIDVAALAKAQKLSLEEAGRQARYRFFARVAEQEGATAVAVGHNADDQAETVLMHLLRGSGLAGMRGMESVAPMPQTAGVWLLRPFLVIPRAAIEQYCQDNQLHPLQDASNRDPAFFRNRLRHQLLPLLADYNPQIKARLQNMAAVVAADEALLTKLQQEAFTAILLEQHVDWLAFDREKWTALPISLQRRTLRQAVWALRPAWRDVTFRPIEQAHTAILKGQSGIHISLPGDLILTVEYGRILIASAHHNIPTNLPQLTGSEPILLPIPGRVILENGWGLETAVHDTPNLAIIQANTDPWQASIPATSAPLHLRSRQPGERFQPLGMDGQSVRLKEVMINRKIPAPLRPHWPIIANADHLIWLVGHQLDERACVTNPHAPIVHLRCRLIPKNDKD